MVPILRLTLLNEKIEFLLLHHCSQVISFVSRILTTLALSRLTQAENLNISLNVASCCGYHSHLSHEGITSCPYQL